MAFKNIIWIDVRKINIEIIEEKVLGIHKKSNKQKMRFILLVLCWTKQVKSAKFADKIKNYSSASCQRKHQVDHVNHNTTINHRPATIDHRPLTANARSPGLSLLFLDQLFSTKHHGNAIQRIEFQEKHNVYWIKSHRFREISKSTNYSFEEQWQFEIFCK